MRRIGIVLASVVALLATAPAASAADSNSCTGSIFDGYVGGVYVKLAYTQPTSSSGRICFRIDDGSTIRRGGALSYNTAAIAPVGLPSVDSNAGACQATAGNVLPGPHPLVNGTAGGVQVYLDNWSNGSQAWTCLRVGTTAVRLIVPVSAPGAPVTLELDGPTVGRPAPQPAPAGFPSATCGQQIVLANASTAGLHLLAESALNGNTAHVCFRAGGVGGRVSVNTGTGGSTPPSATVGNDIVPCNVAFVDFSDPARVFAGVSGSGLTVCVQVGTVARRITIDAGNIVGVPSVSYQFDPLPLPPTNCYVYGGRVVEYVICRVEELVN